MRFVSLVLLAAAVVGCGDKKSSTDQSGRTVYFSAIPDQGSTELGEKFDKIAVYLTEKLGVTVKYRAASDYGASVEMFKNGDIHLAWFGGLTGCQARAAVDGARAIAQGESDPNFYSYFIAHKDTGIEKSATFPTEIGKYAFTFGSQSSTSGRLDSIHCTTRSNCRCA